MNSNALNEGIPYNNYYSTVPLVINPQSEFSSFYIKKYLRSIT